MYLDQLQVLETPSRINLGSGCNCAPLLQSNSNAGHGELTVVQHMEFQLLLGKRGRATEQVASITRSAAAREKQREIIKPPRKQ